MEVLHMRKKHMKEYKKAGFTMQSSIATPGWSNGVYTGG